MKKTLIAYFTRTGITKKLAEDTAKQTGADLFAIEPVQEYSSSYLICVGQAKLENLQNARPAIKAKPQNLQDYDTIVVMFPIWWFTCPNIILTFLEENDLSGKTVIPVCTYGSSDYSVQQMSQFIDNLLQDCAALGIPTPDEQRINSLLEEWDKR